MQGAARGIGAGVYFNPMVPWGGRLIKYGVVEASRAQRDLEHWTDLYVSGRLHKPVRELQLHPQRGRSRVLQLQ